MSFALQPTIIPVTGLGQGGEKESFSLLTFFYIIRVTKERAEGSLEAAWWVWGAGFPQAQTHAPSPCNGSGPQACSRRNKLGSNL